MNFISALTPFESDLINMEKFTRSAAHAFLVIRCQDGIGAGDEALWDGVKMKKISERTAITLPGRTKVNLTHECRGLA